MCEIKTLPVQNIPQEEQALKLSINRDDATQEEKITIDHTLTVLDRRILGIAHLLSDNTEPV